MKQVDEVKRDIADAADDVTASEVAAYAYCAKAWHLERVLKRTPDGAAVARRSGGVDQHLRHGTRVSRLQRFGSWSMRLSVTLLIVAFILLAVAMVL